MFRRLHPDILMSAMKDSFLMVISMNFEIMLRYSTRLPKKTFRNSGILILGAKYEKL